MSRWEHWSVGTEERKSFSSFLKEGNPTGGGLQSPADKARAMGLQSDGRGGYRDPKTGQLVARTVNNELAFYDPGPGGGIVADGNGGAYVTQAQPSWRDPRTGMAMTPPSRPESKQEISAVPYPTPARPPMGFNSFMKRKQETAYDAQNPEPMRKNPEEEAQGEAQDAVMGEAEIRKPLRKPGENVSQGMARGYGDMVRRAGESQLQQIRNPAPTPVSNRLQGATRDRLDRITTPLDKPGGERPPDQQDTTGGKLDDLLANLGGKNQLSPGISHDGKDPTPPKEDRSGRTASLSRAVVRRADELNDAKSMATDLVGETPVMEGIYRIMNGIQDKSISPEMLEELDIQDIEGISRGNRESIKALRDAVYDTLPTKKQKKGDGWAHTSPVVARNIIRMLDPKKKYKVSKSGGGADGMRFTTIPEESFDFSYDSLNNLLDEKIGKPGMRELTGFDSNNVFDTYDPTDIVMSSEEAPAMIQQKIADLTEEFDSNPDDPERNQKLFKAIQDFKRQLVGSKDIMNYSLKKPVIDKKTGRVNNHIINRNVNRLSDQQKLDEGKFNLKPNLSWGMGANADGGIGNIAGAMQGMQWDLEDEDLGSRVLSLGNKPHPGAGKHQNDPYRLANSQTEPTLSGGGAKLGMMDANFMSNPRINDYTGFDFGERYSNSPDPFGRDEESKSRKSRRFTEEEQGKIRGLLKEVMEHKGERTSVQGVFPEGMDGDQFLDSVFQADNDWFDALDSIGIDNMPKLNFRDNEDGTKADRVNNAMTPETKKALKERFGGTLPDVNYPSKIRAKMKQLLMIRALQSIESNGKLDEFGKSEIFRHALKMGDEYSPYLISG